MRRISVIIPVYQVPVDQLSRCLDSIVKQKNIEAEAVLVFDGDDRPYRILKETYSRELSLVWQVKEHEGVSAARNAGLELADGEFVFFADADDWLEADVLEELAAYLDREKADFVMGEYVMEYGSHSKSHSFSEKSRVYRGEEAAEFLTAVLKPQTGAGFLWGKLFRTNFLRENELFLDPALSAGEDAEFVFRAAGCAKCIAYLKQTVYHYRYRADSAVRRYRSDYAQRYLLSMKALKRDIGRMGNGDDYLSSYHSCVLYHLLLIAVNDSFHPESGRSQRENRKAFLKVMKEPVFAEALKDVNYRDFSKSRAAALLCIKSGFLPGLQMICMVRHRQFKKAKG